MIIRRYAVICHALLRCIAVWTHGVLAVPLNMPSSNLRKTIGCGGSLLAICVAVSGCTGVAAHDAEGKSGGSAGAVATALVWLGIQDPPPLPPLDVDLLCDASAGSSCNPESLRASLDVLLPAVAGTPSSMVRLWILGRTVADSTEVATVTVDAKPNSGNAEKARRLRFANESRNTLLSAATPYFGVQVARSPIAETLTKISMTHTRSGASRRLIVLTDAREFSSLGDFECHPPGVAEFAARLDANHVLQPKSLDGVKVVFAQVTLGHIDHDRCPASVISAGQVQGVWEAALHRAGASQIDFEAGPPVWNDNRTEGDR